MESDKGAGAGEEAATCTVDELMNILTHHTGGMIMLPGDDLNLVYSGIYVGGIDAARDRSHLQRLGITHVLNTAKGKSSYHVNIPATIYASVGIKHMAVEATDMVSFPLTTHFHATGKFIDGALKAGGKVLVHCMEGVSRSASVAVAYLMQYKRLTAQQALREVREGREVCPNQGFLQQLCDFNDHLTRTGHFDGGKAEGDGRLVVP